MEAIYIHYQVVIRNNQTGETRTVKMKLDWFEHSRWWWTEGNFGCDCNRAGVFLRHGETGYNEDHGCSDDKYTVIKAMMPDGTEIAIDEE